MLPHRPDEHPGRFRLLLPCRCGDLFCRLRLQIDLACRQRGFRLALDRRDLGGRPRFQFRSEDCERGLRIATRCAELLRGLHLQGRNLGRM